MEDLKRVDYVRLRIPGDTFENISRNDDWRELIETVCDTFGADRKCYAVSSYFDQGLKKRITFFNVWGPMAHPFFDALPVADWRWLLRIDWREELRTERIDFTNLFDYLRRRNQGKGTIKMIDSPYRAKSNGRDIGGTGIMIGAESSDRRLTVYQRAKEGPAVEYHFAGQALRTMVNRIHESGAPAGQNFRQYFLEQLNIEASAYALKKMGLTVADIEEGTSVQSAVQDYTDPEVVLQQMDLLWEIIPPTAKEAFIEAHTNASEADVARAVDAELFVNESDWGETAADLLAELSTPSERQVASALGAMTREERERIYRALQAGGDYFDLGADD